MRSLVFKALMTIGFMFIFLGTHAGITLYYESGTGGPKGTGFKTITCSPGGTSGIGSCLNDVPATACPTYDDVLAQCRGAGRIWLTNGVNTEVLNIWSLIDLGTDSGSYNVNYTNTETSETVTVYYSWSESSPGVYAIVINIV